MRISDWSSDVCSSDLPQRRGQARAVVGLEPGEAAALALPCHARAHRCGQRRHDLDIDLTEDGEAARIDRLRINARPRTCGGRKILNLPFDTVVVLFQEIDARLALQPAVPRIERKAQFLAELTVVLFTEDRDRKSVV